MYLCYVGVVVLVYFVFFCFKQKTAYDMRISDWSSDVCFSDLLRVICDADCETHVAPDVEILQKRIHYALDFANFLRVISNFGDRVKFVEEQNAAMPVGKRKQIADIPCRGDRKSTRLNSSH